MKNNQIKSSYILFSIFAVSGFSGLIYESIWTAYLKLFLGHAAYAQTLVLAIFMGGMALGAWLASAYSKRWTNLLVVYALVELVIGVFAFFFHASFTASMDIAYNVVIPALGSAVSIAIFKWSLAALLILPQSILLGATFPLMSAAVIRRFPGRPGFLLAMLYFTNSLGAAVGVLVAGFYLISKVGLPGTVLAAATINIVVALAAYLMARSSPEEPMPEAETPSSTPDPQRFKGIAWYRFLLAAAFLTGAASFMYEVGWIRMLSFVLGSSTHSFELMLSAFILGLAFGGLWIRNRIDSVGDPVILVGGVQVMMGVTALATLPIYNKTFNVMGWMLEALDKTLPGYTLFNIGSHFIAIAVMVPVTFFAGMTLPLITGILIGKGHGEKVIGKVYAANTLGAIAGLFLAIHFAMPYLGLKGLIISGAGIDILLGVALIAAANSIGRRVIYVASALGVAALTATIVFVRFDTAALVSGVYRSGMERINQKGELVYYRDGKTATVSVIKSKNGQLSILTNGKPDASLQPKEGAEPAPDESTQTLLGAVPLMLNPSARIAANIGIGSGFTTRVLLASPTIERVDTIEIEPFMVEAAQKFRPKTDKVFTDPRSQIVIDDAKAFFSYQKEPYDIIVSEPSNPWVSGVAGLFSKEFYALINRNLSSEGVFIQWLHLYEISETLVASVIKAISLNFPDYEIYSINKVDILIAARKKGKVGIPDPDIFQKMPELADLLAPVGIRGMQDVELLRIGGEKLFGPLFEHSPAMANSDYFPFLDLNAVMTRFLGMNFTTIAATRTEPLPILEMLGEVEMGGNETKITPSIFYFQHNKAYVATAVRDYITSGGKVTGDLPKALKEKIEVTRLMLAGNCESIDDDIWLDSFLVVSESTMAHLKPAELELMFNEIESWQCFNNLSPNVLEWYSLTKALSARDGNKIADISTAMLENREKISEKSKYSYLLGASMLGNLATGKQEIAAKMWKTHSARLLAGNNPGMALKILAALSMPQPAGE